MKKPIASEINDRIGSPALTSVDHDAIEVHAYELWMARGCPIGSPEVDWLQAETELSQPLQSAASRAA